MTTRKTHTPAGVRTWADGFGLWYAAVPGDVRDPRRMARDAIRRELAARGELRPGYAVRIEPAPDHWLTTDRAARPVFREVCDVRTPRGWELNMRAAGYRDAGGAS